MCDKCFNIEIYYFDTDTDYLILKNKLVEKITNGNLIFITKLVTEDEPLVKLGEWELPLFKKLGHACEIYKCLYCNTFWELAEPENAWRGRFVKTSLNKTTRMIKDYVVKAGSTIYIYKYIGGQDFIKYLNESFKNYNNSPLKTIIFNLKEAWYLSKKPFVCFIYKNKEDKLSFNQTLITIVDEYYKKNYNEGINFIQLSEDNDDDISLINYINNSLSSKG